MITNEDILKEISEKELIELSDLEAEFILNQEVIDDAISDAELFISSYFKVPLNPTPLLKQICTLLTITELKRKQNLPKESFEREYKYCLDLLIKMANKKIPTDLRDTNSENGGVVNKQRFFCHCGILGNWENVNG